MGTERYHRPGSWLELEISVLRTQKARESLSNGSPPILIPITYFYCSHIFHILREKAAVFPIQNTSDFAVFHHNIPCRKITVSQDKNSNQMTHAFREEVVSTPLERTMTGRVQDTNYQTLPLTRMDPWIHIRYQVFHKSLMSRDGNPSNKGLCTSKKLHLHPELGFHGITLFPGHRMPRFVKWYTADKICDDHDIIFSNSVTSTITGDQKGRLFRRLFQHEGLESNRLFYLSWLSLQSDGVPFRRSRFHDTVAEVVADVPTADRVCLLFAWHHRRWLCST